MSFITLCIILSTLAALVASAFAAGGNLAPCRSDTHCAKGRSCYAITFDAAGISDTDVELFINDVASGNIDPVQTALQTLGGSCPEGGDDQYCTCVPTREDLTKCSADSDCSDGDQCFPTILPILGAVGDNCLAPVQAQLLVSPKPCSGDADCDSDTTCLTMFNLGVCVARFKQSTASAQTETTPSTTGGGSQGFEPNTCIAITSLRHLQPHQLAYRNHISARVLCDQHGSCATPGHMVRFRGRPMMMKSYCQLVGNCERSITMVNSPRYTRALQIPSHSPHLTFTAFAARYATAAEEHVLRTAVHVGL